MGLKEVSLVERVPNGPLLMLLALVDAKTLMSCLLVCRRLNRILCSSEGAFVLLKGKNGNVLAKYC
jgi:hypothetical protein